MAKNIILSFERAEEMKDMKINGLTLQAIGNQYGLTRERVRQILNSYFPGEKLPKCKSMGKKRIPRIKKICKGCSSVFDALPSAKTNYCKNACRFLNFRFKVRYSKLLTDDEWREYYRERANYYYNKNKDTPRFKKKIKEYNKRAKEKRQNSKKYE